MMLAAIIASWLFLLVWLRSYRRALAVLDRAKSSEVSPLTASKLEPPGPSVSVLIPARNEERSLDACLRSLRAQDHLRLELIVVDDRSTDQTWDIIQRHARADARIVALRATEPPSGWCGKTNALRLAAERATGEWLLTTDADTVHASSSVRAGLAYALEEQLDALSLVPRLEYRTLTAHLLYPQLTAFFGALVYGRKPRRTEGPRDRELPSGASGGWFLIRRDVWDRIGGIAVVRDAVAEDFALARAVVAGGGRFRFAAGPRLWSTPSYATVREFYEGYSRNPLLAQGGRSARVFPLVLATCLGAFLPLGTALISLGGLLDPSLGLAFRGALLAGLVPYAAILALQASLRARLRTHPWMSLFAPAGALIGSGLLIALFFRLRSGRPVTWKGRDYVAPSQG